MQICSFQRFRSAADIVTAELKIGKQIFGPDFLYEEVPVGGHISACI
jgi:hypothetical protein